MFGRLRDWRRVATCCDRCLMVFLSARRLCRKAMPIKTDRRDAEGIARLLHLGWFRPVHCKSVSAQEVRAVLGTRKAIQQGMIALEMPMRGLLRNFGLKVGAISRGRYEHRIRELADGNSMLEAATGPMLRARASLRQELAGLERLFAKWRRRIQSVVDLCRCPLSGHCCAMPCRATGVGAVVALTYKSAVDDPTRFIASKNVGPWVGLTPSRNQSGERDVSGGITKAGDINLRRALCQAATVMLHRGRSTWLRTWAAQFARRRGGKPAMVALARRIGVILHRMWVDDTDFRSDIAVAHAT
jgi:transposase